jgi:hypothetical protein
LAAAEETVVMKCEIKFVDGSDKVFVKIPQEFSKAIGCAPGQNLYGYVIGSEGI